LGSMANAGGLFYFIEGRCRLDNSCSSTKTAAAVIDPSKGVLYSIV
jgi:hypothetical protein